MVSSRPKISKNIVAYLDSSIRPFPGAVGMGGQYGAHFDPRIVLEENAYRVRVPAPMVCQYRWGAAAVGEPSVRFA